MSEVPSAVRPVPAGQSAARPKVGVILAADLVKGVPYGGATSFIYSLLDNLPLPAVVLGIEVDGEASEDAKERLVAAEFRPVARARYPSAIPLRLRSLYWYWRQRGKVLGSGADVLYVHSPELALPFVFGRTRLPLVFHQHGSANPVLYTAYRWGRLFLFRWFFNLTLRIVFKRAEWIVAVDEDCAEQARRHGAGNRVTVLMNAVDANYFFPDTVRRHEKRRELGLGLDERLVLVSGRLEEVKRIDRAIRAVSLLASAGCPSKLMIVGEGTERRALEELAKQLGLSDRVLFLGRRLHREMPDLYNAADALLLTSEREGTPMVVLEALASGTPVVATAVGGVPELIRNGGNGFLAGDGSATSIASALEACLGREWDRELIASSIEKWTSASVGQHLARLFVSVCGDGRWEPG
jgi:glycosyltransferase involved in cell wall biosynthesis